MKGTKPLFIVIKAIVIIVHMPCQGYSHNPTGIPVYLQGCTLAQLPNQDAPNNLSPPSRVLFLYYVSYKRQYRSACVFDRYGVQSSGTLIDLCPTCVVLSRYFNSPVAGPAWSSLAQDLDVCGRHESGIHIVPLPGTLACAAP